MRSLKFVLAALLASCSTAPFAYAQTPEQIVGQQLDKLSAATRSIDSVTAQLRAMLTALGSPTPPVVVAPPRDTVTTLPPVQTGAYVALLRDDFTAYATTKDYLNVVRGSMTGNAGGGKGVILYNDGHNPQLAQIDKSVLYNGHPTLKYVMAGGTDAVPQLWPSLPHTLTRMWLRVKLRYSPGFTTTGVTPNYGTGYKLLGWGWAGPGGVDGRGSLEFENVSQYYFRWSVAPRGGAPASGTKEGPGGAVATEWRDGAWYDYIILVEQTNNGTGMRQRFWLAKDGSTPTLRADQSGAMASGQKAPAIDRIMLGMNFNQQRAANQAQAMWIGQWEVVDGSQYADPFGVLR